MTKIIAPIAAAIIIGVSSMSVAAEGPVKDQEKNISERQAAEASVRAENARQQSQRIKNEKQDRAESLPPKSKNESKELTVTPCNGSHPPSWCN